jgi:hypothetical protein
MRGIYQLKAEVEFELLRGGKRVLHRKQRCRSFTKWFKRIIADAMTLCGRTYFTNLSITDVAGSTVAPFAYYSVPLYWYHIHVVDGIGIGTSDTPFDYTQNELIQKLMDATGLTRSVDTQDYDSSVRFELTGTFNIQQEADIKETGLYGKLARDSSNTNRFLVSRDVLSTPIHVVPTDVLIVRYRITIS